MALLRDFSYLTTLLAIEVIWRRMGRKMGLVGKYI
jgi:hypothetical protein